MFKLLRIPHPIGEMIKEFEMFFSLPQWVHFQTMLISLLLTPFKPTVVGRSRVLAFGPHRTKHNEFLQNHNELLNKVLRFYALKLIALLEHANDILYIIIDDTKTAKRGKHIQAAFRFFDHTTKRYLWGHQYVCMSLVYRGMIIPYAIELYRSKDDCHKRGLLFRKLTEIAEDLIVSLPDFGVRKVYVLADTYYASKNIIRAVRNKGFHFISFLKSNRRLTVQSHHTNVSRYIKRHFFSERKHRVTVGSSHYVTQSCACSLPGVGAVSVVFSQKKGRRTVLPLFSTDTSLSIQDVIAFYRKRWPIEVLFKHTKQYLGLGAYHHRDENAVRAHLQLVFIAYALLTHLFLKERREKGNQLTDKLLASFSLRESQQRLRTLVAMDTLDCIQATIPTRWLLPKGWIPTTHHYKEQIIDKVKSFLLAA